MCGQQHTVTSVHRVQYINNGQMDSIRWRKPAPSSKTSPGGRHKPLNAEQHCQGQEYPGQHYSVTVTRINQRHQQQPGGEHSRAQHFPDLPDQQCSSQHQQSSRSVAGRTERQLQYQGSKCGQTGYGGGVLQKYDHLHHSSEGEQDIQLPPLNVVDHKIRTPE